MVSVLLGLVACGVSIGTNPEATPTAVRTSLGELCVVEEDDGTVISGDHDDFADHALWRIDMLTVYATTTPTVADWELIEYLKDCLGDTGFESQARP